MMPPRTDRPGFGAAILVAIAFFIAIAPTLSWLEFSGGSENLVAAAALEMKRGGPVLVPNLQGEPRIAKPPLATWISAAGIRSNTFANLSDPNATIRDPAFHDVAFQMRWPALAAGCLLLIATYALGRMIFDPAVGLLGACFCGCTILFLRFSRLATTDIHLALWVTVANIFLALALLRGRTWTGWIGTGIALGLAVMSKGPVAFGQTIVPFIAFIILRILLPRGSQSPSLGTPGEGRGGGSSPRAPTLLDSPHPNPPPEYRGREIRMSCVIAPLVGIAIMLAIVLPWVLAVILKDPTARHRWWSEISRENATEMKPDPWYIYFIFIYWIAPTIVWAIAGTVVAVQGSLSLRGKASAEATTELGPSGLEDSAPDAGRRSLSYASASVRSAASPIDIALLQRRILLLLLVLVPIVLMSFAKDKNDRYLLPMVPPAALLAATAFASWVRAGRPNDRGSVATRGLHWLLLLLFVVLLPVLGATELHEVDGRPWFTAGQAALFVCMGLAIWTAGLLYSIRNTYAAIAGTTLLMLFLQYPAMLGYRDMDEGLSDLKPIADAIWRDAPDADVYEYDIPGRTRVRYDLPIYLNRITHKTSDAQSLTAGPRPIALVSFVGRTAQEPNVTGEWKVIDEEKSGKLKWRIYVLPAKIGTSSSNKIINPAN